MEWRLLFAEDRFPGGSRRPDPQRNAFQIDQDRIVFSRPFRRLQRKTQVHPLPSNAHVRNRLVHTLEVASVGRSLGFAAGAALKAELAAIGHTPDDLGYLVQATCLAHDIGNPPFGHAGEEVIADWMAAFLARPDVAELGLDPDLAHFDGNAQGFRILTRADGYRQRGGMKLTFATLAAFVKYPWAATDPRSARGTRQGVKFGHFATEAEAFAQVCDTAGLDGAHPRHPAVWLMEAADDIVYSLADLEDAVELNLVTYEQYRDLVAPMADSTDRLEAEETVPQRIAYLRARAIGALIGASVRAFTEHQASILNGEVKPRSALFDLFVAADRHRAEALETIRAFNERVIYFNPRKIEFEIGAKDVLGKALDVFVPACLAYVRADRDRGLLTHRERQILSLMQDYEPRADFSASENIRCAIDFVAGMTDDYAGYLAARLRGLDPAL